MTDMIMRSRLSLLFVATLALPTAAMAEPSRASFAYSQGSIAQLVVNGTTTLSAVSQGWITEDGLNNGGGPGGNYIAGLCGSDDICLGENLLRNNYFVFDLSGFSSIDSAELRLPQPSPNGYISTEAFETYTVWDTDVAGADLGTTSSVAFFNDLQSGISFASGNVDAGTIGTTTVFTFNAFGVGALNANVGGLYGFGGTLSGGGAVPEPATWAMMILGFGLVGSAARRRRQGAVPA